jgi:tetratricopeptide (TPR) repeat protein
MFSVTRKVLYVLLLIVFCCSAGAQSRAARFDSLSKVLKTAKADTVKVKTLNDIGYLFIWDNPNLAMQYGLQSLTLAQQLKYTEGERTAMFIIGEALAVSGNALKATEIKLKNLKLAEKTGSIASIGASYLSIAAGYFYQGDYEQMIRYTKMAMRLPGFYETSELRINGFLGEAYLKLKKYDSALYYTQRAYEIDLKEARHWSVPYFTLAAIHEHQQHYNLALEYYKLGMTGETKMKDLIDGHLGFANVYVKMGRPDSALIYVRKAIQEGQANAFQLEVLQAAIIAKDIFKTKGNKDSAFAYQELVTAANDSLFSEEKTRAVQNLMFSEQLRQQEAESKKILDEDERKNNLQFIAIALGLVVFLLLFFLFSHSIIANQKLIRFLGVIGLLISFELLNLWLHPYIATITHHSPLLMLLTMVCLAALLIPLHHRLEHWVTHKMVEKNNRIRLLAAKKVISQLEEEVQA